MKLKPAIIAAVAALLIATGCTAPDEGGADAPPDATETETEQGAENVASEDPEAPEDEAFEGHTMKAAIEAEGFTCVEAEGDGEEVLECSGDTGILLQANFFTDPAELDVYFGLVAGAVLCGEPDQSGFSFATGSGWVVLALPDEARQAEIDEALEAVAGNAGISVEHHACA